jgi:hypothetical protein
VGLEPNLALAADPSPFLLGGSVHLSHGALSRLSLLCKLYEGGRVLWLDPQLGQLRKVKHVLYERFERGEVRVALRQRRQKSLQQRCNGWVFLAGTGEGSLDRRKVSNGEVVEAIDV